MSVLSILLSALGFNMEDTDGELGTLVETDVHASGALSRLSECFDLLLNLLEMPVNKLLFLSSSFVFLSLTTDVDELFKVSLSFEVGIILLICGG